MTDAPDPSSIAEFPSHGPNEPPPPLHLIWLIVGAALIGVLMSVWLSTWRSGDLLYQIRTALVTLPLLGPLPIVLGSLFLAAMAANLRMQRRRTASVVLGHLASAVHMNLPLSVYLRSAARGESRLTHYRLTHMASDLDAGDSIASALSDAARELPSLTLDRIAAAEQSFSLGSALGSILERERRRTAEPSPGIPSRGYAAIVITAVICVTWMLMIFVMPKFAQIFADFKLKLPWITLALIQYFPVMLSTVVAAACLILALTLLARATRIIFVRRAPPRLLGTLIDPLRWYLPIYGRLTRNGQMSIVCEALAEALIAGRPLPDAIGISNLPSLNRVLRRKLTRWQRNVMNGVPLAAAARQAGVPGLLCELLAGTTADDGSGAVNAVVFSGRAYAGATHRLAAVLSAIAPVITTGLLAVLVGFIALALFTPIITLLNGMTGGIHMP